MPNAWPRVKRQVDVVGGRRFGCVLLYFDVQLLAQISEWSCSRDVEISCAAGRAGPRRLVPTVDADVSDWIRAVEVKEELLVEL